MTMNAFFFFFFNKELYLFKEHNSLIKKNKIKLYCTLQTLFTFILELNFGGSPSKYHLL